MTEGAGAAAVDPTPSVVAAATYTTSTAILVAARIDLLSLGRHLELDPERWTDAQAAFRIATALAGATRMEAQR